MFTPVETSIGALLLHAATTVLLYDVGAILGVSALLRRMLSSPQHEIAQRTPLLWFFAGMALAVVGIMKSMPQFLPHYPGVDGRPETILKTIAAGLLTGWGTKQCGGCTSGHMLCGIGRLSPRSFLATLIFFPTAVYTFHVTNPSLTTPVCLDHRVPCYQVISPTGHDLGTLVGASVLVSALFATSRLKTMSPSSIHGLAGFTFALGLLISGMADSGKVQAFFAIRFNPFDISLWDPSLSLVILFAVVPNIVSIRWRGFGEPPRLARKFNLPTKTLKDVDAKFVLGAVAFGIAWGWSGICPGPAVVRSVVQPTWGVLWLMAFRVGSLDVFG